MGEPWVQGGPFLWLGFFLCKEPISQLLAVDAGPERPDLERQGRAKESVLTNDLKELLIFNKQEVFLPGSRR